MAENIYTPEQQQQMAELFSAFANLTKETDPLIKAKIEEAKRAKEVEDAFKKLKAQLGDSALQFGKSLLSAGEGTGKYASSVTGASNALGDWVGRLGLAGKVLGGFIKIFGEIAAKSLKQNDDLMKAYQGLSDMGTIAAGGLEELHKQLGAVGLMAEEYDKFLSVLKPVTSELALFGGSVTEGRRKFVQLTRSLIGPDSELERGLARLGYSTQDIREGAADFVKKQALMGIQQGNDYNKQAKQVSAYLTTLKQLQELTGMQRDEAQKVIDQQIAEARFNLKLQELRAQGRDKEADNLLFITGAIQKTLGPEFAAGVREMVANNGQIVGQLSAQAMMATRGQIFRIVTDASKEGPQALGAMFKNIAAVGQQNIKQFGTSIAVAGDEIKDVTGGNEFLSGVIKLLAMDTKKYDETIQNLIRIQKGEGGRLEKNIRLEQMNRAMRIAGDQAVGKVGDMMVSLFYKINEVLFKFGKVLAKIIDTFGPVVGITGTNLSEQFRDLTDNRTDLELAQRQQEQSLGDIQRLREEIAAIETGNANMAQAIRDKQQEITQMEAALREKRKKEGYTAEVIEEQKRIAEEKRKLRELEADARAAGIDASGRINTDKALLEKKARLAEIEQRLVQDRERVLRLEEERIRLAGQQIQGFGTQKEDTGLKVQGSQGQATNAQGQQVDSDTLKKRQAAAASLSTGITSDKTQEILNKLSFKNKDENIGGGGVDAALIGLAERIHNAFPGATFTALNDIYHQANFPNSRHTMGKALDFVLPRPPKTPEEADAIKERIKDLGGSKVLDEYFRDKNQYTTGGHFHVEVARTGGKFAGPGSGFPVMLHGKDESVWPEDRLISAFRAVQKSTLSGYQEQLFSDLGIGKQNLNMSNNIGQMPDIKSIIAEVSKEVSNKANTTTTSPVETFKDNSAMLDRLAELSSKIQSLIDETRKGVDINEQILTYTKA